MNQSIQLQRLKKYLRYLPLLIATIITVVWFSRVLCGPEVGEDAGFSEQLSHALQSVIGLIVTLILLPIPSLALGIIPCGKSKYLYPVIVLLSYLITFAIGPLTMGRGWFRLGLLYTAESLAFVFVPDLIRYAIVEIHRSMEGNDEATADATQQTEAKE